MSLYVDIEKQLGGFHLRVKLQTENEITALLGASGCGKSMTLKCIAGIVTPDRGRIVLNDRVLFDGERRIDLPPQKRRVGYLFQNYALFPNMTVRKNILCGIRESSRGEAAEVLEDALRRFRLQGLEKHYPAQLSGGQQQRVALARILCARPEVILLDEPFSALDSHLKWELELELSELLAQFEGPILWVSHDRGEVFRNCQKVCVIDQGCSQPTVTTETLFRAPATEAAARLSGCKNYADAEARENTVFLPRWGVTLDCGRVVPNDVRRVGIRAHHIRPAAPDEKNAFSCQVVRVIQDVFSTIILLRPDGAAQDAPLLRMESEREEWRGIKMQDRLTVTIPPETILLLHEKERKDKDVSGCCVDGE